MGAQGRYPVSKVGENVVYGCTKCPVTYRHPSTGAQPSEVGHLCKGDNRERALKAGVVYQKNDAS